jgi:predicted Fe-S protein YdhL (DUF1289 family)
MSSRLPEQERRRRRDALRAEGRSVMDETVPSPCVSVCRIDGELCIGCRRTVSEIIDWPVLNAAEKRAVLDRLRDRCGPGVAVSR